MTAYYNENDSFAAAWLRELIKDGLIAPGDVDERSIEDVTPNDVAPYTQCHFFAGIGGWSRALRLAGWPDSRPVWTGSAPCQPFSEAGKGGGFADDRHLWPAFYWLISQCRPAIVFGEQVASKAGLEWWDVVATDLEAAAYACAAFDIPAAGVGAFHRRQRLYWVADATGNGQPGQWQEGTAEEGWQWQEGTAEEGWQPRPGQGGQLSPGLERRCVAGGMDYSIGDGWGTRWGQRDHGKHDGQQPDANGSNGVALGDASSTGLERRPGQRGNNGKELTAAQRTGGGFWSDAEWIICRDGKARPTKPGLFPLAARVSNRVGILRGAGNAIVPQVAAVFIEAYMETIS